MVASSIPNVPSVVINRLHDVASLFPVGAIAHKVLMNEANAEAQDHNHEGGQSTLVTMERETLPMRISIADYRALAELRYRIRHFVRESDAAAQELGLEAQQYLLLLAVRGLPQEMKPTIRILAERLGLKHNSTVELINRMESRGYVRRKRSREDRRCILVTLLPQGEKLLEHVVRQRITQMRAGGVELVDAMTAILGYKRRRQNRSEESSVRKP